MIDDSESSENDSENDIFNEERKNKVNKLFLNLSKI